MSKCDDFFKEYPHNANVNIQVAWLRSVVPDDIDPDIYPCILDGHVIKPPVSYNDIVSGYWGTKPPVYTNIKLKDIKDDYFNKPINYEYYIVLIPDEDGNITHGLTSKFTLDPPCYSLPFFEALYKKYGKVMLRFTLGRYQGRDTVTFFVMGKEDNFYDFSQIPPFSKNGEPIVIAV